MKLRLPIILAIVTLTAMGVGIILPILPALLRDVGHTGALDWRYGALIALYALMQFVCSPVLGALSDRYGRRPVLLVSSAGMAIDYIFMAFAPSLGWLFVGRAIAGVTGANMATASAYIADVTPEDQRARRFGYVGAAFGGGFILGPVLGGVLGDLWVRAPFIAAAGLAGLSFLVACFGLPESRVPSRAPLDWRTLNPVTPLRWAFTFPALTPLLAVYGIFALVGEIGGTLWIPYGEDRFHWSPLLLGVSLGLFGLFHAGCQAFLAGPVVERWGEKRAIGLSMAADAGAQTLLAFVTSGLVALLITPIFCLGAVGQPALQSLLSRDTDEAHQGRLQGVITSIAALASVVAPLAFTNLYFATRPVFPGFVWIVGAALYGLCVPLLYGRKKTP
jgi:DHA1 family tetracycline resistance protein-like MFS transporter